MSDIEETQDHKPKSRVIGYQDLAVAKLHNMLPAEELAGDGRRADTNSTARSVFIMGPDKEIKPMLTQPMTTGRHFEKILRVLDSKQLTAQKKFAALVNWQPVQRRDHRALGQRRWSQQTVS